MKLCVECNNIKAMGQMFSKYYCRICSKECHSGMGTSILCSECSYTHNRCKRCGKEAIE